MKLGIITDIHEDIINLKTALKTLEKKGCNEIACLGDITGFEIPYYSYHSSRNTSECIAAVRAECSIILPGNHDLYSLREIPNHKAGFHYPHNWYDLDFAERKKLGGGKVWLYEEGSLSPMISKADKEFLASLPEFSIFELASHKILFSHALFPDPTGSQIWGPEDHWSFKSHFQTMKKYGCDVGFSGHFHPNGIGRATEKSYSVTGFGKTKNNGEAVQYICPCIARGEQFSGFAVFDTQKNELETIQIKEKLLKKSLQ